MITMNILAAPTTTFLGNFDLCDGCGARAKVLVILANGGVLLFCGHHARTHQSALEHLAIYLEDPSEQEHTPIDS
jgi:hypothetical protein